MNVAAPASALVNLMVAAIFLTYYRRQVRRAGKSDNSFSRMHDLMFAGAAAIVTALGLIVFDLFIIGAVFFSPLGFAGICLGSLFVYILERRHW